MENNQVKKAEETKKSKRGRKPRDPNILTQALSLQILKPADPGITWQELRKALTKASKRYQERQDLSPILGLLQPARKDKIQSRGGRDRS